MSFSKKLLFIIFIVSTIFFLFVGFNVSPFLRGPGEWPPDWRWPYLFVNTLNRIWFPLIVITLILSLFYFLEKKKLNSLISLVLLVVLSYFFQLSILYFSRSGISVLIHRIINPDLNGYFTEAIKIKNLGEFLANYQKNVLSFSMHATGHPPGSIIFFWLIEKMINVIPLFQTLIVNLIPKHQDVLSVWNSLTLSQKSTAVFSAFFIPSLGSLNIVPLFYIAKKLFNFNDYELVISVTSSFAKSIITQPKTKHICYLLTPTRFLWSHQKDYFKENIFNKNYLEYLKQWDLAAAQRPDKIFSISETAKNRCKKYYHRDSEVIYPPFDTEYWRSLSSRPKWRDLIKKIPRLASLARNDRGVRKKYFLIVSRLEPYKKIDLAINVFNKLNDNLVIVGEGSEENNLRRISGGNITFFKKITDEELGYLYSNAQALIMPQEEDFGYISLEAQFFGCPAISYKKGGALETVIEGKTGIFFDKQSENSLRKAVERFAKIKYNLRTNTRKHGEENVKRFSKETFINNFRNVISSEVDLPTDRQGNLKKIPRRFAPRDDGGCVMKAIIFAGGTGTRLWPLSRKKSPKQFEKLIGNKSTLQLAVERLLPDFQYEDIYISSNSLYKESIKEQLPQIPEKNLILEPEKKDVAPAIALSVGIIAKTDPNEPIAILWSDHLVKEVHVFRKILKVAAEEIKKNPNKIIFITHKPRFASINLGYIHFGKKIREVNGISFHEFKNIKYRPDEKTAKTFFNSGEYAWNLGYFVTTPQFILKAFRKLAPEIYANTEKILACYGKKIFPDILKTKYGQVKNISFDNAILEKLAKEEAMVIVEDIGWSDVGSWEALKEALESHSYENVIRGKVYLEHVRDSLIYNYQDDKLIVGVDLDENIIVNTNDVILIAKKNSMPKVKNLVENFTGTKHEKHI